MKSSLLVAAALLAAMWGGCGGGGGAASPGPAPVAQNETVVVRYDRNGDDLPDLMTLDRSREPYVIVASLDGTADGGALDTTDLLRGASIDPAISHALALYLGTSYKAGAETDLDVADSTGRERKVTVFE